MSPAFSASPSLLSDLNAPDTRYTLATVQHEGTVHGAASVTLYTRNGPAADKVGGGGWW